MVEWCTCLRRRPSIVLGVLLLLGLVACERNPAGNDAASKRPGGAKGIVIAMLPKLVNIDYFQACERGARKTAEALGVELIYDGPNRADGAEQNRFIELWIRQKVDAICIAPNQPESVRPFVARAREAGIFVLTWDTDAKDSGRDLMVNQVDATVLGEALIDDLARQMGGDGEWAVVLASLTASNLREWREVAEARARDRYPGLRLVSIEVTNEDENVATEKVEALLNARPLLEGILALDSNSVPGAAAAIVHAGKKGKVALVGNSTPGKMRRFIEDGVLESFYLWDPRALGSLTVACAKALVEEKALTPGMSVEGIEGALHFSPSDPKMVILSPPIRFTRENIAQYDFGI
jgi:rhamnose transport system substrate-binding protein